MDHFDFFKKHIIYVFISIQKEYSALHEAIRNGHIGLSKYLIHEGADVNMKAKVKFEKIEILPIVHVCKRVNSLIKKDHLFMILLSLLKKN